MTQGIDFHGEALNLKKVEVSFTAFMLSVTARIKEHHGTIVVCNGDRAVAYWRSRKVTRPLECALAISQIPNLQTSQVLLNGKYLLGSLGDAMTRAFTVVGPLQLATQKLMRMADGEHSTILITEKEFSRCG